ncbi:uncharacterized protein [Arachis hypogaea]|uniref:uncharacterized protein n=1 Tax=Arachis hypogaea TaxID=3818 RepID=UPI0007AF3772|nr:uncharacterized protein LOC112770187 [Arachis hypogaea]
MSSSHLRRRRHAVTSIEQSPPSSCHLRHTVTSIAQSPPSTSDLRRAAAVVRWNLEQPPPSRSRRRPLKVLHHWIPFNAVMSPFFQDMLDGVAGIGPGYKGPSYDTLRVNLLADLKRKCQMIVDSYRSAWKETGCTLMADEVIEWIRPDNIVHVVTDNAANYVAAGRLINKKFENIHWSPCAAYCLNLILKDISSMPHISNLATRASKITMFVYNHTVFLSWLRQRTYWREIVRPGRSANGRAVSAIILDNKFWDDCFTTCQIVSPLIKLLRLVDADDKPSLGIVYEDSVEVMKEIHLYRDRKESFDRPEAIPAAKRLQPDKWWRLFGSSAPCLQNMAVHILSQASASSG